VLALGFADLLLAQDEAQVVLEPARDRVLEREGQDLVGLRPRGHASAQRIGQRRQAELGAGGQGPRRQSEQDEGHAGPHRQPSAFFAKFTTNATSFAALGASAPLVTRRRITPFVMSAMACAASSADTRAPAVLRPARITRCRTRIWRSFASRR